MVNYPYPANVLKDLPGWPVKQTCTEASKVQPDYSDTPGFDFGNLDRLAAMIGVWQGTYDDK